MEERPRRVLSIQSHVVSGYCGNKAATFPLQTLGYDVDVMNTVEFSNHTGYPSWAGLRLPAEALQDIFAGMEKNGLLDGYSHLLIGYIGTAAGVRAVIKMAEELKRRNRGLIFVCDPVMGDDGKLYVSPDVVPIYRQIQCIVDVVTPNQFEAETLASRPITSLSTALQAVIAIHDLGPPYVIITTLSLPDADIPQTLRSFPSPTYPSLYCLGSHRANRAASPRQFLVTFPAYPGYFTGAGDLFSALVIPRLAEAIEEEHSEIDVGIGAVSDMPPLARAVSKVVASVNAVVRRTSEAQRRAGVSVGKGQKPDKAEVVRKCELQLVKGRVDIEKPVLGGDVRIAML